MRRPSTAASILDRTTTKAIGKYCWRAVYSGDGFYNGSDHTNATDECFTSGEAAVEHDDRGVDAVDARSCRGRR